MLQNRLGSQRLATRCNIEVGGAGGARQSLTVRLRPSERARLPTARSEQRIWGRLRAELDLRSTCTWWSRESFPPSTVTELGNRSRLMRQCWVCPKKLHHVTVHKSPSSPRDASSAQRASHHHAARTIINTLGTATRTSNMQNAKKTATTAFTTKHQQHPHQHHHPSRHHHYDMFALLTPWLGKQTVPLKFRWVLHSSRFSSP